MKAPIIYRPGVIHMPDSVFKDLLTLDWRNRDAPREEYYCNEFPVDYTYGSGRGRRSYSPQPWTPAILGLKLISEAYGNTKFDTCFLNRYKNERDQLGWHADDSPEMDDARPIAIISLGAEREIWFRPKPGPGIRGVPDEGVFLDQSMDPKDPPGTLVPSIEKLKLEHGSLCLMTAGMQDTWQHRIPKASFKCGERISLTFRGYVNVEAPRG